MQLLMHLPYLLDLYHKEKTMTYVGPIEASPSCNPLPPHPSPNFTEGVTVRHFEVTMYHISFSQSKRIETHQFPSLVLQMFLAF